MEAYFNRWGQLLTYVWSGWQGKLFTQSLAALAARSCSNGSTEAGTIKANSTFAQSGGSRTLGERDGDNVAGDSGSHGTSEPETASPHTESYWGRGDLKEIRTSTVQSASTPACGGLPLSQRVTIAVVRTTGMKSKHCTRHRRLLSRWRFQFNEP